MSQSALLRQALKYLTEKKEPAARRLLFRPELLRRREVAQIRAVAEDLRSLGPQRLVEHFGQGLFARLAVDAGQHLDKTHLRRLKVCPIAAPRGVNQCRSVIPIHQ